MILFNVVEYKTHLQERNRSGSQEGEEMNLFPSFGNTFDLCIKKKLQGGSIRLTGMSRTVPILLSEIQDVLEQLKTTLLTTNSAVLSSVEIPLSDFSTVGHATFMKTYLRRNKMT